jgi:hypothetical protein
MTTAKEWDRWAAETEATLGDTAKDRGLSVFGDQNVVDAIHDLRDVIAEWERVSAQEEPEDVASLDELGIRIYQAAMRVAFVMPES